MRIRRQDHPRGGRRLVTEMIADSGSGGSGPSAQAQSVAGHRNTTRYKRAGENKEKKKERKRKKETTAEETVCPVQVQFWIPEGARIRIIDSGQVTTTTVRQPDALAYQWFQTERERGWVERRGGRRRVDFLVRPMSEQKGGEEEPEREAEGAAGALVGICYDLLVLFIRPFLVRNVTGLIKQLVRHQKHDSAVRVVQERERERAREAGTHLLLATGMETVAGDSSSVPFGMSSSSFIRPHHPPPRLASSYPISSSSSSIPKILRKVEEEEIPRPKLSIDIFVLFHSRSIRFVVLRAGIPHHISFDFDTKDPHQS